MRRLALSLSSVVASGVEDPFAYIGEQVTLVGFSLRDDVRQALKLRYSDLQSSIVSKPASAVNLKWSWLNPWWRK